MQRKKCASNVQGVEICDSAEARLLNDLQLPDNWLALRGMNTAGEGVVPGSKAISGAGQCSAKLGAAKGCVKVSLLKGGFIFRRQEFLEINLLLTFNPSI